MFIDDVLPLTLPRCWKRRFLISIVFGISLLFTLFHVLYAEETIPPSDTNQTTVFEPVDNGQGLVNPYMGWTAHFYSNVPVNYGSRLAPTDTLDWFEGEACIYLRIPWAFIEPEEGKFNWAILDTPAQRWIEAGKQVGFRFTTSENWIDYATPTWVFEAGAKKTPYIWGEGPNENGTHFDPVFDDPIYLEKLEHFLAAAGKRYNNNPNVAFIDVGTFGMWGEGHTLASSKLSPEENARIAGIHVELHRKYFPDKQLFVIDDVIGPEAEGDDFPLMNDCISKGIGLRDDSILVQPAPKSWFHSDLAQKFWPKTPVFIEHEHYGGSKERGAWDNDLLYKSVEDYHATYMSIHWWPQIEWAECKENIQKINRRLGYRLQLRRIEYPKQVKIGEDFQVKTTWANAGVAPCYNGGFMALTLTESTPGPDAVTPDGTKTDCLNPGIVSVLSDETLNMNELAVGPVDAIPTTEHVSVFRIGYIAPTTKPGKYFLWVSVGERDGTPVYTLPYDTNWKKRYCVGTIELIP